MQMLTTYAAMRLANRIEKIRNDEEVTLEELAMRIGSSKSHMSRVLSGNYTGMSLGTLVRISAALGYEPYVDFRPLPRRLRKGALTS